MYAIIVHDKFAPNKHPATIIRDENEPVPSTIPDSHVAGPAHSIVVNPSEALPSLSITRVNDVLRNNPLNRRPAIKIHAFCRFIRKVFPNRFQVVDLFFESILPLEPQVPA